MPIRKDAHPGKNRERTEDRNALEFYDSLLVDLRPTSQVQVGLALNRALSIRF